MLDVTGNLWTYPADFRIITTNGAVRGDGCAVMGRGCAKEATLRYRSLKFQLGQYLTRHGNHVHFFAQFPLFTFPVKHSWEQPASFDLIAQSVRELATYLDPEAVYVMPRPGCGNGRLAWEAVRPLCASLPDNVHIITYGPTRSGSMG